MVVADGHQLSGFLIGGGGRRGSRRPVSVVAIPAGDHGLEGPPGSCGGRVTGGGSRWSSYGWGVQWVG